VTQSIQREWCAYVRVSKVQGREGESFHSPAEQEDRIRKSTSEPVRKVFTDLDVSGGTWAREGLDGAVAWMRQKPKQRGMVVMDIDRLGRDLHGSLTFFKSMDEAGLKVRVLAEEIETAKPDTMVKWKVLMLMAELQREKIGERWKSIHSRRREAGRPASGKQRFGYQRLPKGHDCPPRRLPDGAMQAHEEGDFVPDPVTGPLLAKCYRDYTKGAGYQSLVKYLNDKGATTSRGTAWSTHSLRRTLDSGFGAGLLIQSHDGSYLPGRHEPVISEDEWKAFQRARSRRKEKPSKVSTPKWYLSGIARCGLCGHGLIVSSHLDPNASVLCGAYKNTRVCTGVWIPRYMVETAVSHWVGGHIGDLAAHAWDASGRDEARVALEARLEAARQAQEQAQEHLSRLATGYATGLLDERSVRDARPALEAAKEEADAAFTAAYDEFAALAPVDLDEYERLARAGDGMTPSEWGHLLGRVLRSVRVTNTSLVFEPVVGEVAEVPRPTRRPRAPQAKDPRSGRFLSSRT
jgi:site-specific DNA recombinase